MRMSLLAGACIASLISTGSYAQALNQTELPAHQTEQSSPPSVPVNRAYGVVDPHTKSIRLDINDRINISERKPTTYKKAVDFVVVDGFRSRVKSCAEASALPADQPRPTVVTIEYGPDEDHDKAYHAIVARTLPLTKNLSRFYRTSLRDGGPAVKLEDGIFLSIRDGKLTYLQHQGPIGPRNKASLEITLDIAHIDSALSGEMKIDSDDWRYTIARDLSSFEVNGKSIGGNYSLPPTYVQTVGFGKQSVPAVRDMSDATVLTPAILVQPTPAPAVFVADASDDTQDQTRFLCPYVSCSFGYQCAALYPEPVCDCWSFGSSGGYCGNR